MALLTVRLLIFASLVLSLYMIVVTLERCRSEKRYGFIYCIATIFLYSLGYFIEITSGNVDGAIVAIKIMYAGGCFMSPFFFLFVADYCEVGIPKKYYTIPVLIVPVLFYGIVLTFDRHKLLYLDYYYNAAKQIPGMVPEPGPLYLIGTFYPLFCIALTCIVLIRAIVTQGRGWRLALVLLLISCLAPLIANFGYVLLSYFSESALAGINFTALVMVVSNFIFYYNVIRNDLFDFAPKAHAITMDLIRDAFVVLDRDMAYSGSNKVAQELFPALKVLQKGAPILLLENWPAELANESADSKPDEYALIAERKDARKEIEFILPHRPEKIYSGWKNRIASEAGGTLGWVILIQDITETERLISSIRSQRDEIAAMRDNLREGLFLMDRQYRIQSSYSKALEDILMSGDLRGRRFTDLLRASYRSKDIETITDYFNMIMDKSAEEEMLEEINPLGEFLYISAETGARKNLRCRFVPVEQANGEIFVMGTILDISAETALKKQLAEEEERRQDEMRNLFEMLQVDQKVFGDFIEDTDDEFSRIISAFKDKKQSAQDLLVAVFQSVHAIKSNALLAGLSAYAEKLHRLESEIKVLRDAETSPASGDLKSIAADLENLRREKEKLIGFFDRIRNFSAMGSAKKDDEVFVESLRLVCEKAASAENKKVIFSVENFDKEALASGPRRIMKDMLTQLARNAVYHGIEKPEERLRLGKNENGKVSLSLALEDGGVRMLFEDDGKGLDFERIARKAETFGLLTKGDARGNDRQFLSSLIFTPGFSTSGEENIHAGRGIGLNLVKDRLREARGKIQVNSKKGRGLAFDIQIPLNREQE